MMMCVLNGHVVTLAVIPTFSSCLSLIVFTASASLGLSSVASKRKAWQISLIVHRAPLSFCRRHLRAYMSCNVFIVRAALFLMHISIMAQDE